MYIQRKYEWVDKTDIKTNIYKFEKLKIIAGSFIKVIIKIFAYNYSNSKNYSNYSNYSNHIFWL